MLEDPIANDPCSFLPLTPLTEEDHRALAYVYELLRRKAEEWYIKTRREIGDARLALDIVVLKPLCEDCCTRLGQKSLLERALSGKHRAELVILLPEDVVPERVRLYDGAARCVHLWPLYELRGLDGHKLTEVPQAIAELPEKVGPAKEHESR